MNYCANCSKDYGDNKLAADFFCTSCKGTVREIKNQRLAETLRELSEAVSSIHNPEKIPSPKEIIAISKVIEKGEKKLSKEHSRRIAALEELQFELTIIQNFASKMGYTLDDEPEEMPEEQTE